MNIYCQQRSCGKVMFSQASVILFTGGSLSQHAPQVTWLGGSLSKGGLCLEGLCLGVSVWQGVSLSGNHCLEVSVQRGLCLGGLCLGSLSRGVSVWSVSVQGCLCPRGSLSRGVLNIGYVSNETNTDVCMYTEEFILVDIWIHCCTKLKWRCMENTLAFIQSQQ